MMKRTAIFLFILLSLFMIGCSTDNKITGIEDITKNHQESQLNIKVDPRMELLAVIQHFTSWKKTGHTRFNFQYKKDDVL